MADPKDRRRAAREILDAFAHRTGLEGGSSPPRRYLWTDAFAVCTFLALHRTEGGEQDLARALRLVEEVHETLGRHRADDARTGWISGLDDDEGRAHPTLGGLRIGKRLRERAPHEMLDERLEWDRDGQYFHYLTRWMHALAQVARATADGRALRLAVELARTSHAAFTYLPPGGGRKRMVWKMSIDLTRPLVPAMGAHDPLDGLLTFRALRADALQAGWTAGDVGLDGAIADLRSICAGVDWRTADALGIGGLLCDAHRLAQLSRTDAKDAGLLPALLDGAAAGLAAVVQAGGLQEPAAARLAFRELGLSIGLHAVPYLARILEHAPPSVGRLERQLDDLRRFVPLAEHIETFWRDPVHEATASWQAHVDINSVMLATSLTPEGYLSADPTTS